MAEPKVRFKRQDGSSYPAWVEGRFGDLIQPYVEKVSSSSTLPVLTSSKTNGIQYQSEHFGREQLHDISGYNVIPRGYCTYRNRSDGTDFTFNINNLCEKGIVSKFYPVFRATEKCNIYFLMTLMNNEPKTVCKIAMTAKGTGQKVLSFIDLQNIAVNIPCQEEQDNIADFLSSVDDVISTSEQEVANLETQKKAVMKKIFSQEVRFKRPDGTGFPEWEEIILTNILSEYKEMCEKDGTYEHVSLTKEGVVPKTERYERDFLVTTEDKKYRVTHLNDICYNPANLKFGVICRNKYKDAIFSPIYVTFTVNDKYAPEFIEMVVTNEAFIQRALKYQQGTVYERMAVSPADLLQMTVGIPCLEEQRLIADFLSDFDEAIAAAKKELELWKQLKKGLLQQMFV